MSDEKKRGPGQPPKYTPEELNNKFDEYLDYCKYKGDFPNIAGFAVFAKMNRDTYYNYKSLTAYSDSIKRIETDLLNTTIQQGVNAKNPAFTIFYTKNMFGWADKQEVVTTGESTVNHNHSLDNLTLDDLRELLDK